MSNDPQPDQTLPGDLEDDDDPKVDNTLPGEQPPRGPGQNRGRDEDARRNAPGQNK